MLRHANIDRVCCLVLAATLLLTFCLMGAASAGVVGTERSIGYENRLFDQSRVHTLEIVMDDWEGFLDTCTGENYSACTVVIEGERYTNVAIRGKGNTSLSSVASYGNDRYSFKIEFDQYQSGRTYHGLDKLCLNNLIQDKTYLKDYAAYTLMNKMGVAAPLCSFVQINVNGEAWGLYLAVEGVEDSFLLRNYGNGSGDLYKPDSMSLGGGRGNGREFDMEAVAGQFGEDAPSADGEAWGGKFARISGSFERPTVGAGSDVSRPAQEMPGMGGFGGANGSSDVMLQYIDDDPDSYANIFGSAKTDVSEEDQKRLIASLKALSAGNADASVDKEAVLRYFAVHSFLCNDDSYTGAMVHNYYLYEEKGLLAMIPWDYNLAFGGFGMGRSGSAGATSAVNSPIDSPVTSGTLESRPMAAWIFADAEDTSRYHEIYAEFIETVFANGWFETEIGRVIEMIAPYVEKDVNGFFSYEEFRAGSQALLEFCDLRAQSVAGQLDGTVPSTAEGQLADSANLIDASAVSLSDLGEFGMGGGRGDTFGGRVRFMPTEGNTNNGQSDDGKGKESAAQSDAEADGGEQQDQPGQQVVAPGVRDITDESGSTEAASGTESEPASAEDMTPPGTAGTMPEGMTPPGMAGTMPEDMTPPGMAGTMSEDMTPPGMPGTMSEDMTPPGMAGTMPEGMMPPGMAGTMPEGMTPPGMAGTMPEAEPEEDLTGTDAEKTSSGPSDSAVDGGRSENGVSQASDAAAQDAEESEKTASEAGTQNSDAESSRDVPGERITSAQRRTEASSVGSGGYSAQNASPESIRLAAGSVVLLLAGLLFAWRFRRNWQE